MNNIENNLIDNALAINNNLIEQNKLYKERIDLLESSIKDISPQQNVMNNIMLPRENSNSKDTSLRISDETKKALEQVRFDFIEHYRENLSYSQTIFLLIEIYKGHNYSN